MSACLPDLNRPKAKYLVVCHVWSIFVHCTVWQNVKETNLEKKNKLSDDSKNRNLSNTYNFRNIFLNNVYKDI